MPRVSPTGQSTLQLMLEAHRTKGEVTEAAVVAGAAVQPCITQ